MLQVKPVQKGDTLPNSAKDREGQKAQLLSSTEDPEAIQAP